MKSKIVIILGPTAVGKTKLALGLAQRINAEIVNADSQQVYRYLDIGTGKPSKADRERVRHHLIDVANADEVQIVHPRSALRRFGCTAGRQQCDHGCP